MHTGAKLILPVPLLSTDHAVVVPIHVQKERPLDIALDLVVDLKHGHVLDQVVDQQHPVPLLMLHVAHLSTALADHQMVEHLVTLLRQQRIFVMQAQLLP